MTSVPATETLSELASSAALPPPPSQAERRLGPGHDHRRELATRNKMILLHPKARMAPLKADLTGFAFELGWFD